MSAQAAQPERAARAAHGKDVIPGVSMPKALFILAAGLSFLLSVYLFFTGSRDQGIFVGIWVPSILSAGTLLLGRNGNE